MQSFSVVRDFIIFFSVYFGTIAKYILQFFFFTTIAKCMSECSVSDADSKNANQIS